jgi:hypothetical protein
MVMILFTVEMFMGRHVIGNFADAADHEKAGDQNIGARPVVLPAYRFSGGRCDFEASPLAIVENGGEDAGRIKVRKTEPIDRPVHRHQRGGVHVADDAVIFDRLITQLMASDGNAAGTSGYFIQKISIISIGKILEGKQHSKIELVL